MIIDTYNFISILRSPRRSRICPEIRDFVFCRRTICAPPWAEKVLKDGQGTISPAGSGGICITLYSVYQK